LREEEKALSKNLIKSSEGAALRLSRLEAVYAARVCCRRQDLAEAGGDRRGDV
jgi:hypothetical protein